MNLLEWKPDPPLTSSAVVATPPKLGRQTQAVHRVMTRDHGWFTFDSLRTALAADGVYVSETGVSARIRDLRKAPLFLTVDTMKTERKGIFAYRVRA